MKGGRLVPAIARFAFVTAGVAVAIALLVPDRQAAVRTDLLVLFVGGAGIIEALRWLTAHLGADPNPAAPLVRRRRRHDAVIAAGRPPALIQLELLARTAAHDGHVAAVRLRPRLAALALSRLRRTTGIDGVARPDRAAAALGDRAWPLVRPVDHTRPDHDEWPVSPAQLEVAIDALERL